MSWGWITLSAVLPLPFAIGVARLVWRRDLMTGNVAGSAVILAATVFFMGHEYMAIQQTVASCGGLIATCNGGPDPFTRMAPYAFTGFVDVIVIYVLGLRFDTKIQNSTYAPEWRR